MSLASTSFASEVRALADQLARVQLRSRLYAIYSDAEGHPLEVALVFHRLCDLRARFPSVNNPGKLVFLGFPSVWEARRATGRTGVRWPDA